MSETMSSMGRGVRFFRSAGRVFAPTLLACLGVACSEHAGQADGVAALPAETNGTNATSATARAGAAFGAARVVREKGAFAASRGGAKASTAGAAFSRAGSAHAASMAGGAKARAAEARAGRATARAGASAAGAELDVERYDLAGTFDWSQNRLFASVTVTLGAASAPPARVVLDSRVSAVTGVSLPSGEALAFEVDADARTLAVELGARATPGVSFVIDYEASTPYGSGLFGATPLAMYPEREGDPNPARVVYTFSEPELARDWLPSHDDPSDGAFFSVDLHVGYGERLIANGDLVADTTGCGQEGRMKYATAYPLPTYLMAFALGEFEVEEKTGPHGLPLSVWHRPGLQGDYKQTLSDLSRLVKRYESLTGVPYPYEKYALVLVPDFFGGEENVSISFQAEADSNQPELSGDNVLTAHELAHQWFGDLVTVETWDDLWIKEGMASLLEWEGTRAHLDRDGKGLADGDARHVAAGEAVRDLSLAADQKYTSGPYDRAAWLLSQVRHLAGEGAFWGTLRQVLNEHRFGSIGTDAFLEAFRPVLGDATLGRVRQALDAQGLPALTVEALASGGARVTLNDPEGALLAPMRVAWHRAGGVVETIDIPIGMPVDLVRKSPGDLLVIDPLDLHPAWANFLADEASGEAYFTALAPLRLPATGQTKRFLGVGGAHQLAALSEGPLPAMPAHDFDDFLRKLDSDAARATAVASACEVAVSEGGAWKHVVKNVLRRQPFTFGLDEAPQVYGACAAFAPANELFPGAWQALALGLSKPVLSELETEYMLKLPASPAETLRAWAPVAAHGYSTRVRSQGATALAIIASQPGLISDAELPAWRAKAGELVASSTVPDVVFPLIFLAGQTAGPTAADNAAALAGLGEVLSTPMLSVTHPFAGCTAYALTQGDEAAWQAFAASLEGAELSELIEFFLLNPAAFCG